MRKLLICTFLAVFILIILPVSLAAQDAANPMVTADHPGGNGADNGSSDHFRLVRRGTEVLVYIDGDFSQSLTWDLLYTLTIEGSGDDDTLTVDFSGGTPIPPGGLTFNGRGDDSGVDTLEIAGNSESTGSYHPVSRSDGTIIIQESVIHFTGLEPVLISSVASLTFDMGAETSDINITYETGPSTDHGLITATSSESLEFWDVNNLEIISGSGSDIIDIINPFVPLNLQTFTVDGGPGDDTFNVTDTGNGLPGPVSLNGGEDNDTFNVSPSTSAVINIDGENGNDTLIVDPHGEKAWFSGSEVLFYGESGFKEITCTNIETVTFLNAGSISGTKFNDLNGNGVKNARDTGLELWQIFIDIDLNGVCDAGEPDTSTDTDGNYTFTLSSGTYRVREVVQSGWSQSTVDPPDVTLNNNQSVSGINFGNYQPATKRGRCFDDLNGNGSRDDEEPGLKGWTINLDGTDGLGQTVSLTTTTNDDGLYSFEVPPGKYTISQVLQTGWVQTFPDIPGDGDWDVTLTSGETGAGNRFGNYQPATKRGKCFDDLNGNGSRDDDEPGLEGWTIDLNGIDGLGQTVSLTTTTDDNGLYIFEVPPGTYTISQVLQTGWVQTFPDIPGDGDWDVTLTSGQTDAGNRFGNYQPATKRGRCFEDLNGNGSRDDDEPGLEGWTINLNGTDGMGQTVSLTTTTNDNGLYVFEVPPGNYTISQMLQTGWVQTFPDIPGDGDWDVTLISGQNDMANHFGNYQPATKRGRCFDDLNGNGSRDDDEPGLEGWTIDLNGIDGLGQTVSLTTTTDDNGLYIFEVPPGTYTISQVLQTGWVQTFPDIPGDGDWDVTLTSGQKDRANHFGNYQPPDLTITKTHTGSFKRGQTGATYTITVTNNGTGPTIGTVTVNDSLPAGLHTAGLNGEGWTCDPVTLTCTRSDALAAGDSYPLISLTVNVDQAAPDPVTNSVTVSGTGEIDTANNTGNDLTGIVSEADLSITGTGNAAAHIGYCYIYTLTVLNNGPSDVTGVSATDTLPSGATCHSSTPGKGKYDSSTGIWTIGNLASGEAASLILEIMAESLSKTDLTNTAQVTGNETDPDYDNNSLSQNTRVIIPAIGGEVIDISKSRMLAPRLSLCLIPAAGVIFLLFRRRKEN